MFELFVVFGGVLLDNVGVVKDVEIGVVMIVEVVLSGCVVESFGKMIYV